MIVDFYGCKIEITKDVILPRPETEILAELIIQRIPNEAKTLVDLCCGPGGLGLAIKKHRPKLRVVLSDISPACIELVKRNAKANGLEVETLLGDLQMVPMDYLVCNPPYISEEEYQTLDDSVKSEPKHALVADEGGLYFYRRIERELPQYMKRGKAFFEIGYNQGESVPQIFSKKIWKNKEVLKDWAGWDRFFFVEL